MDPATAVQLLLAMSPAEGFFWLVLTRAADILTIVAALIANVGMISLVLSRRANPQPMKLKIVAIGCSSSD